MTTVEKIVTSSTVRPKRFRVDEFRKMTEAGILPEESGWEIIDGYLIDKMTIGSRHASIVNKLTRILISMLGERAIVSIQNPIHIDEYNEPEPDIALLGPREDFYESSLPTAAETFLVVEVSDSTLGFDREIKLNLYAEAGITEVWLVNLVDDTIEQYSSPENGRYGSMTTVKRGTNINSLSVDGLSLGVSEILGS
jgi:Uma2 family endonuclease